MDSTIGAAAASCLSRHVSHVVMERCRYTRVWCLVSGALSAVRGACLPRSVAAGCENNCFAARCQVLAETWTSERASGLMMMASCAAAMRVVNTNVLTDIKDRRNW